jgi:ADP-heptose:LPS heptosyltransferase
MKDYKNFKTRILAEIIDFLGLILFFWIREKKIDPDNIKRVLIIKLDRIGDTFLATPTIEAIRKRFAQAKIFIIVAPWNKEVLENNPNIDEIIIFEEALNVHKKEFFKISNHFKKCRKLVKIIKNISPEIGIDLEGHPLNVLTLFLSKVPIRIGFGDKVLSFLLTNKTEKDEKIHQSDIYFRIAKAIGFRNSKPEMKIFVNEKDKEKINPLVNDLKNFIVFHLGAGRTYRQWPLENFINLAKLILKDYPNLKIVVIGGEEDKKLVAEFTKEIKNNVVDMVGKLKISEVYHLLSFSKLFVGNESAPMHLAGSLNIPTVAFMNEWSGIERWKPIGEKVYIFKSKKIHNCPGVNCKLIPCPNMAAISVDEVYNFIKEKKLLE